MALPEHAHDVDEAEPTNSSATSTTERCCFCALRSLFYQYEKSEDGTLPPDVLRKALSNVYTSRGRFQLGEMEDATETLEALLDFLHACAVEFLPIAASSFPSSVPSGGEVDAKLGNQDICGDAAAADARSSTRSSVDSLASLLKRHSGAESIEQASNHACQPRCIAHEVFGLEYVDLARCTFCGATREPSSVSSFFYGAYVAELLNPPAQSRQKVSGDFSNPLFHVAKVFGRAESTEPEMKDVHDFLRSLCQHDLDSKCRECSSLKTMVSERWLTRQPFVFVLSLVWPTESPSADSVRLLLSMVKAELRLDKIFRAERDSPRQQHRVHSFSLLPYIFRGLVCYRGMHYVAIFWSWPKMKWIIFDDMCLHEELTWTSVVRTIVGGNYVPTLLMFERPDASGSDDHGTEEDRALFIKQVEELDEDVGNPCSTM